MIVVNGGPAEMEFFAFGEMNPNTRHFLETQGQTLSQTLTDAGRAFMSRGEALFEKYHGAEAIRMAKAAIRNIQHAFQSDIIRPLYNMGALQQAPMCMQRWIMAAPVVRSMYHMQRCDGYSNTYVDVEPGAMGENHTDWRTVNNGLVQTVEDADFKIVHYYDGNDDDVVLTLSEQVDILSTWDLIASMMKPGKEDPTSPFCDRL